MKGTFWAKTCTGLCLGLLLLGLVGCDTSEPDEDARQELIGTWSLERFQIDTYLTTSTSQEIIDPDEEGEGRITLTGDLEAELSYLRKAIPRLVRSVPVYASDVPLGELGFAATTEEAVRLRVLELEEDPMHVDLFVGMERRYSMDESSGVVFDAERTTLSFDDVTFSASSGATVTANGTIRAATQTLPANEETPVGGYAVSGITQALVLTFEEDGTFTAETTGADGEPETSVGTWRVDGNALVLEAEEEGAPLPPQRVEFYVEGGQLVLDEAEVSMFDVGEEELLPLYEEIYGVEEGTLVSMEQRRELRFVAAPSP